ncbi:MAG: hypothetical protein IJ480_04780 [Clostridia bacterium]|nr:hypothetical protein [Clostridia bacterium]
MTYYGRPKTERAGKTEPEENHALHAAAGRILALGCAMIAGFFIALTNTGGMEFLPAKENTLPEEAVAVMSTAVSDRETLAEGGQNKTSDTAAEPFGYLDGEWNLWEYIGDLMWSLLS